MQNKAVNRGSIAERISLLEPHVEQDGASSHTTGPDPNESLEFRCLRHNSVHHVILFCENLNKSAQNLNFFFPCVLLLLYENIQA